MISHENLMKNGFIRINISLTIGKTSRYYEIIPKQKKSACKKIIVFWWKKCGFFRKIRENVGFIRKNLWENVTNPMVFL